MLLTPREAPGPPPDRDPLRIVVADDAVLLREGLVRRVLAVLAYLGA